MPQSLAAPASLSRPIQEEAVVLGVADSQAVAAQEAADSQVAVVALAAVVGIDNKKS